MKILEAIDTDNVTVEQARDMLERHNVPERVKEQILREVATCIAARERLETLAERMRSGEEVTWDMVNSELDGVAREHGYEEGLPMPHLDGDGEMMHRLCLANGSPLSMSRAAHPGETELAARLKWRMAIRNSWDSLGDQTVLVVNTEEGPKALKEPMAGQRLRKLFDGSFLQATQPTMTAEAELRAMGLLEEKVSENQYRSYVLNGTFIERSKRSDLVYFFRKGYPTLALSWHGEENKGGRVLAALCLHPVGYYDGTHVGTMAPTDEVIAALLWMRADEHEYWKKSGQWHPSDPRSGL